MNHLKYRNIRKKYHENGGVKAKMHLGNSELLCPTLLEYNMSGMAEKFVEKHLSMSLTPPTAYSRMRKRKSDVELLENQQDEVDIAL